MSEKLKGVSLNTLQSIQQWWEKQIVEDEDRTPRGRFERAKEEFIELEEAVLNLNDSFQSKLDAGFEAIDVIIVMLGVIDALGFDAERLIEEKLDINFRKYNPVVNRQLREQGMSSREAIKHQKQLWKGNQKK